MLVNENRQITLTKLGIYMADQQKLDERLEWGMYWRPSVKPQNGIPSERA